jgi:hypothetical protein
MDKNEKLIAGYGPLSDFLTDEGYPISRSTLSKYGSPSVNIGPPSEGYWGRLPTFLPSRAIEWARSRLSPTRRTHTTPDMQSAAHP